VLLGLATSIATGTPINFILFFLVVLGAISAHISVNTFNEYYDFKNGLDLKTNKTAFSGGSGALPEHPEIAKLVFIVGLLSLLNTTMIGIYLVIERGLLILPFGLVGVVLIVTYTKWLNRMPFLCLVSPGLGFGVLMVVGTHVILTGEYSTLVWLVSLVPFFLVNNLLLLNQYPDIKADTSVGRKTFPIVYGIKKSNFVYALFSLVAYLLILFLILIKSIPVLTVIALIPAAASLFALFGANKVMSKIGEFPQYMAANVVASILTPLLLSFAIIYG
jgi:1,4-dihydroxy-2-naphthoate polyprenyltransferase